MTYRHIDPEDYPKSTPKSVLLDLDRLTGNVLYYKEKLLSTETGSPADGQFGWDWYRKDGSNLIPVNEVPFIMLSGRTIQFHTRSINRQTGRKRLVIHGERPLIVRPGASNEILIEQESY